MKTHVRQKSTICWFRYEVSSWQEIDCHRDQANLQVEIDLRVYPRLGKLRMVNTACVPSVLGQGGARFNLPRNYFALAVPLLPDSYTENRK